MDRDQIFEDLIKTIERNAVNNIATITNVELWAKSWRDELRIYLSDLQSDQWHWCGKHPIETKEDICNECRNNATQ